MREEVRGEEGDEGRGSRHEERGVLQGEGRRDEGEGLREEI